MKFIRFQLVLCIQVFASFIAGIQSQCPIPCHCHGDLQHVICDNVGLKKIPQISEATRLLNMQRNNLGMLPTGGFSDMKGLISLHLQHCQIREITSQAFKGLKKLIYLYLSDNEISTIKPGAFDDLTELTYLHLNGNRISSLSKGMFSPMINLFILQLDNNKIRDLQPGTFAGAKDLRWLHMSRNELSSMQPGSLDEVENLAILTLDQNKLSTYPIQAMSKLRVVEELNLSKNPLSFIPDHAFRSFGRYIEKLNLNDMGLEKVSISNMHYDVQKMFTSSWNTVWLPVLHARAVLSAYLKGIFKSLAMHATQKCMLERLQGFFIPLLRSLSVEFWLYDGLFMYGFLVVSYLETQSVQTVFLS